MERKHTQAKKVDTADHDLRITVQIGKLGITDTVVQEIKKQLKKRKIIKIKFLKNFIHAQDKDAVVKEIIDKTNARKVTFRGFTLILKRKEL